MISLLGWGWGWIILGGEGAPKALNIIFNKKLPIIIIIIIISWGQSMACPLRALTLKNANAISKAFLAFFDAHVF